MQSPGDIVMLTAAVRDLHLSHPGEFLTDVRTTCPELWCHNPFITPLEDNDPEAQTFYCHYPLIHKSNQLPYHFIFGFMEYLNEQLGLRIKPSAFKGDIHLGESERQQPSIVSTLTGDDEPYWIINAGGKMDFTAKWWSHDRYQEVVDYFKGKIRFVQVGESGHHHPPLKNVINLVGKTNLRQLILLVHQAQGVLTPVSLPMHLAAGVETRNNAPKSRPCVVIAGGREPVQWEAYPHHQYIHTVGSLPCCAEGGCWKSRVRALKDGSQWDAPSQLCVDVVDDLPHCLHMITAEEVCKRIAQYFDGKDIQYASAKVNGHNFKVPESLPLLKNGHDRQSQDTKVNTGPMAQPTGSEAGHNRLSDCLTTETAVEKANAFMERIPPFPDHYEGQGIVICGGGARYFTCAWVCINMLRDLGCTLPIELWHLGEKEVDYRIRSLISHLDVTLVDAMKVREKHPMRILNGWELKPFAIKHSGFKEVMLLDADNVAVKDPTFLFEHQEYLDTGAIFWPDFGRIPEDHGVWEIIGIPYRDEPEFETGQLLVNKEKCWKELCLTVWYNAHSDFFYQHMHGDKETFHMAWARYNTHYTMIDHPVEYLSGVVFLQYGPDGDLLFQHRNFDKWQLNLRHQKISNFRLGEECEKHLINLREWWDGSIHGAKAIPDFSADTELKRAYDEVVNTTWEYIIFSSHTRKIAFHPNGQVSEGYGELERYWMLGKEDPGVVLNIYSAAGEHTIQFHQQKKGKWKGRWLVGHQLMVEINQSSESGEILSMANAPAHINQYLEDIGDPAARYEGRGIVICGGGLNFFPSAWVCIRMLRKMGSKLPIELWHLGPQEMDQKMRKLLAPYHVQCVDALQVEKLHPARILNGWELKAYSILHSRFREVLFLDADNTPLRNPDSLFEEPEYLEKRSVLWPDRTDQTFHANHAVWKIMDIPYVHEPAVESGQLMVDKIDCWKALKLAVWMNDHSDFFYRHLYGDKDTFHFSWRKVGQEYAMPEKLLEDLVPGIMIQHDFAGDPIFQHRHGYKWELLQTNPKFHGFRFQDECFGFVAELKADWNGVIETEDPTPRVAVITMLAGEAYRESVNPMTVHKHQYCEKHGYDLFIGNEADVQPDRPVSWWKVPLIKQVMTNYEFVLWLDGDATFMNMEERIEHFFSPDLRSGADLILKRDLEGNINMGTFLIRRSEWAFQLLDRIWDQEQFIHHPWWENQAFIHLYENDGSVREKTKLIEDGSLRFNIYPHADEYREGDFIIHFAGLKEEDLAGWVEWFVQTTTHKTESLLEDDKSKIYENN